MLTNKCDISQNFSVFHMELQYQDMKYGAEIYNIPVWAQECMLIVAVGDDLNMLPPDLDIGPEAGMAATPDAAHDGQSHMVYESRAL